MKYTPDYSSLCENDRYGAELMTEYIQCLDEGLDIECYKALFESAEKLHAGEEKEEIADAIFSLISKLKLRKDYKYTEPDDFTEIISLCEKGYKSKTPDDIENRLKGAWYGRIAGCLLGKTVEGVRSDEFIPFLKLTDNYPLHRYITSTDCNIPFTENTKFDFRHRITADKIDFEPADDDTNYMVLAQKLIETKGKNFTPLDVIDNWITSQPKSAYFTAERVAFINRINGFTPPLTAKYKNKYREYIGAQIRIDYYAYINAGNPSAAAEMAFRDASISHTKNGIYGAMFCAAMISAAAVTDDIGEIVKTGMKYIPTTSRLYEAIYRILSIYENECDFSDAYNFIHTLYDEQTGYGWCHAIPNACIVTAALLWGKGDYGKSICLAVGCSFDTDCNGATVGSIIGIRNGFKNIDKKWLEPLHGELMTEIVNVGKDKIDNFVAKTIEHMKN